MRTDQEEKKIASVNLKKVYRNNKTFVYKMAGVGFYIDEELTDKLNKLFQHYKIYNKNDFFRKLIEEKFNNTFKQ